jgi:hypothetical protein
MKNRSSRAFHNAGSRIRTFLKSLQRSRIGGRCQVVGPIIMIRPIRILRVLDVASEPAFRAKCLLRDPSLLAGRHFDTVSNARLSGGLINTMIMRGLPVSNGTAVAVHRRRSSINRLAKTNIDKNRNKQFRADLLPPRCHLLSERFLPTCILFSSQGCLNNDLPEIRIDGAAGFGNRPRNLDDRRRSGS